MSVSWGHHVGAYIMTGAAALKAGITGTVTSTVQNHIAGTRSCRAVTTQGS
ncbi:hypothetical protein [Mycolicibacterium aichiense]|uniref:hypothetical protein n=1 Tax=Mycolicibacterium aichiense TaxID=1799 RepID=UPI0013CFF3C0|nr:hypothetical protein [Mycolicibacterium aichiense]MCV7016422.1 hypothetical protein [Mycolicibacterium aichiense]